jgi:chemotaxis signal transduction protein
MSGAPTSLADRVAELRLAFDRAFAAPLRGDTAAKTDFIAIRVGSESCAIRLAEVRALYADSKITRVPGGNTALLGIANSRGELLPAYRLRTLLGLSGTEELRWLVIAAAAPVAFAYEAFEGHLRASAESILPRQSSGRLHEFAPELIRSGDVVRPIIALSSVIAALGTMPNAAAAMVMQE